MKRSLLFMAVTVALAAAVSLAGCAQPAPPGPAEPAVNPAQPPASQGGTVRHGGSPAPDATTRKAVIAALKADGIEATDGPGLVMTYSADRQTIAVNGSMKRGGQGAESIVAVTLENKSGAWVVVK